MKDDQAQWLQQVFGVKLTAPGSGSDGAKPTGAASPAKGAFDMRAWRDAYDAWTDAREEVGQQVSALQSALLASGVPQLVRVGEFGLNGITGTNQVAVAKTLMGIRAGDGSGPPKGAAAAVTAIRGYRSFLRSDEIVDACDRNPLKVPVNMKGTLDAALARMELLLVG